jgi:hypothetical protein
MALTSTATRIPVEALGERRRGVGRVHRVPSPGATLSFCSVIGSHSSGIHTLILLPSLSVRVSQNDSAAPGDACHMRWMYSRCAAAAPSMSATARRAYAFVSYSSAAYSRGRRHHSTLSSTAIDCHSLGIHVVSLAAISGICCQIEGVAQRAPARLRTPSWHCSTCRGGTATRAAGLAMGESAIDC